MFKMQCLVLRAQEDKFQLNSDKFHQEWQGRATLVVGAGQNLEIVDHSYLLEDNPSVATFHIPFDCIYYFW